MEDGTLHLNTTDRSGLLNCLWHFQRKNGYIADEDVEYCARRFQMSTVEVEGVLSFYHFFSRKPRGEFTVYLNKSVIAQIRGYQRIKEAFEQETGSVFGDRDVRDRFGLFETSCIGLSDQEPAALINFHPFTNLNSLKVREIVKALRKGARVEDICDDVVDNIRHIPPNDRAIILRPYERGEILKRIKQLGSGEAVLKEIIDSGLRGMGGAFFPTGMKWSFCANEPATPRYVVCNADEGEPGTYKDRVLLHSYPGLVIEGMLTAGYAIESSQGIIYLRAEYAWLLSRLEKTIEVFKKDGLLGKNILGIEGFDFDIRVQMGAGSYVCGEETALLNSMEGKRGEPRTKQYFPTQRGYLGKPTVVNNVETFCAAARVIELGAKAFRNRGTEESPGTKLISISGDCERPGIYEIEWGMPVCELIGLCGADDPHFIQVSGPSGECISTNEHDRKICMEDLKCGGSFMIFDSSRKLIDILVNFADFFKSESCGVCTPCRGGNFLIRTKLEKLRRGLARQQDLDDIDTIKGCGSHQRGALFQTATIDIDTGIYHQAHDLGMT